MRNPLMRLILTVCALLCPTLAFAQAGNFQTILLSGSGQPLPGVNVAVCSTGLTTTAASVTNNIATLTMSSNPITARFLGTKTLTVSSFTGGDTYFNGTYTIAAVGATTISYALTHANASATSNGKAFQTGDAITSCAPVASLFTDDTATVAAANPTTSDSIGNVSVWAASGVPYQIQYYGANVVTKVVEMSVGLTTTTILAANNAFTGTNTTASLNAVLTVGVAAGQYASLQAAHDALPASGGTIQVMGNATPFGPSFNTPLAITKPIHIIADDASFTAYSGASTMISCSGVNGVTIEGSGHTGSDSGTNGTTFNFSNGAANGIAFVNCSGYVLRNFNLVGPGQGVGTSKGLVMTSNRGDITDVNVRSVGSDCITIDGSATNANVTNIIGGRASLCGGNDYVAKGTNGNLVRFIGTDGGPSTGDCYNIASLGNKFISTNCSPALAANICYHFVSGGSNNSGDTFCDGPSTTGYKFENGANGNLINNSADVGGTLVSDSAGGSGNRYFPTVASVWNAWNAGQFGVNGATSGVTAVIAQPIASGTLSLPATTDTLVGKATTDNLSNKTIVSAVLSTGVAANGSGFKHQRFGGVLGGTCPTAAAIGAACTSGNLNWPTAFADNSYTVVCTLNGSMTGQPHIVSTTYQAAGAGITLTIAADTAVAANVAAAGFVDCNATHD